MIEIMIELLITYGISGFVFFLACVWLDYENIKGEPFVNIVGLSIVLVFLWPFVIVSAIRDM